MSSGLILPVPSGPFNPESVEWANYLLSLRNVATDAAPSTARFVTTQANPSLSNEINLGSLTTGLLFLTVAAGIATPSTLALLSLARGGTNADLSATGGAGQFLKQTGPGVAVTVAAIAAADLAPLSSTYTPVRSAEVNLASNVVPSDAKWTQIGALVTVSGRFTADPTTTATPTSFELTLPVASNLGAVADLSGVAFCGAVAGQGAEVTGSIANNTAVFSWVAGDVASRSWSYFYQFLVI